MASYNAANSLSPMMFKKAKDEHGGGTRNERWRSKSVEHIYDSDAIPPPVHNSKKSRWPFGGNRTRSSPSTDQLPRKFSSPQQTCPRPNAKHQWKEVDKVKSLAPVVTCILPSLSMDFVASSLLAIGAVPLIPEDPADVKKDLVNCKAILVSASAPQTMVEAFVEAFNDDPPSSEFPFVLVADNCGTNDRKKQLVLDVLDEIVPTVVSGRLGDIFSVAQGVIEKNTTPLDSPSDISDFSDEDISSIPKVTVDGTEKPPDLTAELPTEVPPVLRKFRKIKAKSVSPPSSRTVNGDSPAPRAKSPSPAISPRSSPRNSPVPGPRGCRRMLAKRERETSGGLHRVPTVLPMVKMKGQFRETQMNSVPVEDALENAHKLCTYSSSFVHLYETNTLTSGERVVEIDNTQLGMGNLHSTLTCSGAVMAAVLACVDLEESEGDFDSLTVDYCAHGLAVHYVAAEEAAAIASEKSEKGLVSPGTLKAQYLDALHSLGEEDVRTKALLTVHSGQLKGK